MVLKVVQTRPMVLDKVVMEKKHPQILSLAHFISPTLRATACQNLKDAEDWQTCDNEDDILQEVDDQVEV